MLNTCLTVRAHQANSHAGKGWEEFTQKVIDTVVKVRTKGVVIMAWGGPAKKRITKVNRGKHCVLESVHPSPLSAAGGFVSFLTLHSLGFHADVRKIVRLRPFQEGECLA